jgi:hypothetical protein
MALSCPCLGWIGVGWNKDPLMPGADSVYGSVAGSTITVSPLKITGYFTPGTSPDIVLTDTFASEIDGVTTIFFTREINKGSYPIKDQPSTLIAAYKDDDSDTFDFHGFDTHTDSKIRTQVNFFSGETATSTANIITIRDTHGIIMFIAWGLILPFGAIWARYTRDLPDDIWFKVHRIFQYGGFAISLGGIILGYYMVGPAQFKFLAHSIIGTVILFFSASQVVVAFFRPHKQAGEPVTTARKAFEIFHHWNGRGLLALAVAQIYLGIAAIGYIKSIPWVIWLWTAWAGLMLLVVIILEIRKISKMREESKDDSYENFQLT